MRKLTRSLDESRLPSLRDVLGLTQGGAGFGGDPRKGVPLGGRKLPSRYAGLRIEAAVWRGISIGRELAVLEAGIDDGHERLRLTRRCNGNQVDERRIIAPRPIRNPSGELQGVGSCGGNGEVVCVAGPVAGWGLRRVGRPNRLVHQVAQGDGDLIRAIPAVRPAQGIKREDVLTRRQRDGLGGGTRPLHEQGI